MGDLPWSPGYRKEEEEVKAGWAATDVAASVAAFAVAAAGADVGSRRPQCHRQQQRHKRHTAELRVALYHQRQRQHKRQAAEPIDAGATCRRRQLRRRRPQGWELRGQHALVL